MGNQLDATPTPFSEQELVNALDEACQTALGQKVASGTLAILCAQVALETANGKKCIAYNLGNFKAPQRDNGNVNYCYFATTEYINGKATIIRPPDPGTSFAAFGTLEEGSNAYVRVMLFHWSLAWKGAWKGDIIAFVHGLKQQGYFTAPEDSYLNGAKAWFNRYIAIIGNTQAPDPPDPSTLADLSLGWYIDTPSIVGG